MPAQLIRGESGDGENLLYSVEYSEEFQGNHEHGGDGAPVSYAETPFSTMDAAQADGGVPRLLPRSGDGHAPLYGEILTVAVIEPDL